jgi:hypothetical protein
MAFAALALCAVAFWLIQESYVGLVHDSVLYTFGALSRLHPETLSNDIFVQFGSQDRYTVFSPLYAAAIRLWHLEPAAALLTLCFQLMVFGGAWLVARRLMSPIQAILALGLLATMPSVYGSEHKFAYTEVFLTPRLPAEALALAGVAAVLGRRFVLAAASFLGALLLHPLMAAPGIFLSFVLLVGIPRPRLAILLISTALVGVIVLSRAVPFGSIRPFDPAWFDMVHSGLHYLFPSMWPAVDWAHAWVPLAELTVGWLVTSPSQVRSVYGAALLTGLAGIGLTLIGADLMHIELMTQIQTWRWLWLTNALAVLAIPVIAAQCWQSGAVWRAAAILLAAAWVCVDETFAPVIAALAIGTAAAAKHVTTERHQRLMMLGACGVLLIGALLFVGTVVSVIHKVALIPADTTLYDSPYLLWLRGMRPWVSGGVVPASVILLVWWLAVRRESTAAGATALALSTALCIAFAPLAVTAWTRTVFSEQLRAEFSPWRREIPPLAQVLWIDSPLGPWYLLERSSYWTAAQTAGVVFSRDTAMELARREILLKSLPSREHPQQELEDLCKAEPSLGYLVIGRDLGPTPFPAVPFSSAGTGSGLLRLYRCADHRG